MSYLFRRCLTFSRHMAYWLTDCQMVNIRSSSHFLTLANDSLGVVPSPSLQEPSESDKPGRLMSRNGRKPISCGSRSARRKSRREVVWVLFSHGGQEVGPTGQTGLTSPLFNPDIFGCQSTRPSIKALIVSSVLPASLCGREFKARPRISLACAGR